MTEIVDDGKFPTSERDPRADVSGRKALISAAAPSADLWDLAGALASCRRR